VAGRAIGRSDEAGTDLDEAGRARSRPAWPPIELVIAPLLVLLLINVLTPTAGLFPNQFDVLLYFQKAEALAHGGVVYRDVPFEYPPLALVPMVVPYLAWPPPGPTFEVYRWLFLGWEGLLLAALVIVVSRIADRLMGGAPAVDRSTAVCRVAARVLILAIATAPSLAWRFDLFPALLTALAVLAALQGRAAGAGVALGLGILAKLYPAVLIPVLALAWLAPVDRRRLARFGAGLGTTVALGLLPVVLLAGDAAFGFVAYQAERGLQLETVPAGLILLRTIERGAPARLAFEFGAVHVAGPLASAYLAIQPWLTVAGFSALAVIAALRCRLEVRTSGRVAAATVVSLAAASILLFLVTNKVFSVQYVVWLVPFAALLSRGQFWLTALVAALSVGIHPLFYDRLIDQAPAAIVLLNVRNGLVLVLLAWVVASLLRGRRIGSGRAGAEGAAA
jgi:hypothetical protein